MYCAGRNSLLAGWSPGGAIYSTAASGGIHLPQSPFCYFSFAFLLLCLRPQLRVPSKNFVVKSSREDKVYRGCVCVCEFA